MLFQTYWFILLVLPIQFNMFVSFSLKSNGTLLNCKITPERQDLSHLPLLFHTIENCHRKIQLTLHIENKDKTPEGLEYIFIKDVVENSTGNRVRLLNPILLRIRQEQVILSYPFKYLSAVNGKAAEVVLNYENRKNYSGCDDTSQISPTCGLKHEKGVIVPYSEGFCCFCPENPMKEKQVRGGQDCSISVGDPDDFDKQKYKASAHCLHTSDVWYSVSALKEPFVLHEVFLQVYTQKDVLNGSSVWVALTHDEDFELGINNPYQYDENKTIVASYVTSNPKNVTGMIPYMDNRLLIPQPMPSIEAEKIPLTIKNGATDYLLLPKNLINSHGAECDVAGVSYEGFAKQKDRCKVPKDTCLKNQPLDFWEADNEKRKLNKKGAHLLENFGTPYKDPVIVDAKTKEHWLALEYYENHLTTLTIELNADHIIPLHSGKQAQISTVVTSSIDKNVEFHVRILNSGLVAAEFSLQALRCGYQVPDSNNISAVVPPQLMHEFLVSTNAGALELNEKFTCVVELSNRANGVVAKREVTIKPHKRCICNTHCQCVCMEESLKCKPMDEEDYHLAGFQGSLPILTAKPPFKSYFEKHPKLSIFAIILFLLLFGLIKASFGLLGFPSVSTLGLSTCLYQPKKIPHYYESEIRDLSVIYDANGYPINPNTKERAKVFGDELLFLFNLFFCCFWPCICVRDCLCKRKDKHYNNYPEESTTYETPPKSEEFSFESKNYDTAAIMTGDFSSSEESGISDNEVGPADRKSVKSQSGVEQRSMERTPDEPMRTSASESALREAKRRPGPLTDAQLRWQKGVGKVKTVI